MNFIKKNLGRLLPACILALVFSQAQAFKPFDQFDAALAALKSKSAGATAPDAFRIETGFSPNEGSEELVIKVIQSARQTIRLAAYSFTSAAVTRALIDARRRGVEVGVVVDYKHNVREDRSGKARHVLSALVNAGIPTRTISAYDIHHDKFLVADSRHLQTGSFNYSQAAATRNSENVLVIWNQPQVAAAYLRHWQSRYEQGADYVPSY